MRFKVVLYLTLCILSISNFSPAISQMRKIHNSSDPDNLITKFSFYNAGEGYVAFRDGLGYTTDSGRTFTFRTITYSNVDFNLNSVNLTFGFIINGVVAFNKDTLVAYGNYGLIPAILFSGNGGSSYKLVFHNRYNPMELNSGITDMVFPGGGRTGFAVDGDRVLKSTNSGQSWTVISTRPGTFFSNIKALDVNNLYAYNINGPKPVVLKTNNGGVTWQDYSAPPDDGINSVHFISPLKGWINMLNNKDDGATYYTADGGSTWARMNDPRITSFGAINMHFTNDSTGYAITPYFDVYKTTDSGKVWEKYVRDNNFSYLGYHYNDIQFWNENQFWAGGGGGLIEINTNPAQGLIPKPVFLIDTTNYYLGNNTVNLINYSKKNYSYKWLVNRVQIGTAYNASYEHLPGRMADTITLIVKKGAYSDTLEKRLYYYPPVIINSFSPKVGTTGTLITISGQNLIGTTEVSFGGIKASGMGISSDSVVHAIVGSGASGAVAVTTSQGRGSLPGFVYALPPVVSSFTPVAAAAGTPVMIKGTDLLYATSVSFGGVPARSFTINSPTSITAVVGEGANGSVSVTTPVGISGMKGFTALPVISDVSSLAGTVGSDMLITGTGLDSTTSITIGGIPVLSFVINSPTSLKVVVGNGNSGPINVIKPGGTVSFGSFTYTRTPVITSFTPLSAPAGSIINITGSNFNTTAAANVVYFGGTKGKVVSANTNSIAVEVPFGAVYAPISVTTNALTAVSEQSFIVSFPNGGTLTPQTLEKKSLADIDGPGGRISFNANSGDLDGDGKTDLLIMMDAKDAGTYGVMVFRNTTTDSIVSFEPPKSYPITSVMGNIYLADMDGDGNQDMVLPVNNVNKILVYRNISTLGKILFDESFSIDVPEIGTDLAIGDLDGDGKPDIVYYTLLQGKQGIIRNTSRLGQLSFDQPVPFFRYTNGNLLIRDIDKDGKPDFLANNYIYKNLSSPGLIRLADPLSFSSGYNVTNYSHFDVGDIDGDGKIDIVLFDVDASKVALYKNTSNGDITFEPPILLDAVTNPSDGWLNDFDGDGHPDIVMGLYDKKLSFYKNYSRPGILNFSKQIDYEPAVRASNLSHIVADINTDGRGDVIYLDYATKEVLYFENKANGAPSIQTFKQVPVCANGMISLNAEKTGLSYFWEVNEGSGFKPIISTQNYSGIDSSKLTIKAIPLGWNNYQYRCKIDTGNSIVFVIKVAAVPNAMAGDDKVICSSGTTVSIGGLAEAGLQYSWLPKNGLNNDTIAQPISAPTVSTQYELTVTNALGCIAKDTVNVTIQLINKPLLNYEGIVDFCEGGKVELTSGVAAGNQWYFNGIPIPGAISNVYSATKAGDYSLIVTSNGCSSPTSLIINLRANPKPFAPAITISGNTTICNGDTAFITSSTGGALQWFRDNIQIPDETGVSLNATRAGIYTVILDQLGCKSEPSNAISITSANLTQPVIVQNGNQLSSSAIDGNQWFKNGVPIPGANDKTFMVSENGIYSVKVYLNSCISDFSNSIEVSNLPGLVVGPNPVLDRLIVRYKGNSESNQLALFDMSGHPVTGVILFVNSYELDVSGLVPGQYIVRVVNSVTNKIESRIIIKL